ncbi:hypothetical protein N8E89_26075 (plasmid) [Phyllobacterium sp. A18/5-2]|uniref:hypothetical protein n=1 Tax=Phyllobacterium sp. A18/5-2 TaxID=2978392 RepID=UPI0021C75775|nr:hypothetical protein [Phyllobacterium sp. A18/5-2]UXN66559.1 hypothetical protein N8E89_26075 [Phyllobacterium sp. A18/5-2]
MTSLEVRLPHCRHTPNEHGAQMALGIGNGAMFGKTIFDHISMGIVAGIAIGAAVRHVLSK